MSTLGGSRARDAATAPPPPARTRPPGRGERAGHAGRDRPRHHPRAGRLGGVGRLPAGPRWPRDGGRPPHGPRRGVRHGRGRRPRRPLRPARARDRPGPARPLAPPPRPVAAVPARAARLADHRRLRAGRQGRRAAPVRPAAVDLPGRPGGDGRRRAADRGRRDVVPEGAATDGLRDLVVGAPVHLPRAVPVVLAPGRHRGVVRRSPHRTGLVDGAVGRNAGAGARRSRRATGVAVAAPPPDGDRRDARGPRHLQRAAARPPPRPAAGRRRPVHPMALPAPRPLVAGAPVLAIGRADRPPPAHHDQGPGRPQRRAPKAAPRHARGDRGAVRASSPPTGATATACC